MSQRTSVASLQHGCQPSHESRPPLGAPLPFPLHAMPPYIPNISSVVRGRAPLGHVTIYTSGVALAGGDVSMMGVGVYVCAMDRAGAVLEMQYRYTLDTGTAKTAELLAVFKAVGIIDAIAEDHADRARDDTGMGCLTAIPVSICCGSSWAMDCIRGEHTTKGMYRQMALQAMVKVQQCGRRNRCKVSVLKVDDLDAWVEIEVARKLANIAARATIENREPDNGALPSREWLPTKNTGRERVYPLNER